MRKIKNILYMIIAVSLIAMVSCDSMDDIHEEFLEGGEHIYLGQADSVKINPGYKRLELEWLVNADPRVTNWTVFWDNGNSSLLVEKASDMHPEDTVRVIIDELEEQAYTFEIVSSDPEGNKSLPFEITDRVYGDLYASDLKNRPVASFSVTGDFPTDMQTLNISWEDAPSGCLQTKLIYHNIAGEDVSTVVLPDEKETVIEDWQGEIKYVSEYKPVENAIDMFGSSQSTLRPVKIVDGKYFDLAGENEDVTVDGITMVSSANDWGYPDTSDGSKTSNGNCYDEKSHTSSDFSVAFSDLAADKAYMVYIVLYGKDRDFDWGTAADGSPVNDIEDYEDMSGTMSLGNDMYAVPLNADFTSDATGALTFWLGKGGSGRTQFDGVVLVPVQ
ncbi:DUF4998 domain-containing protein [Puteibacter caeruleilacunae]|nr:DUF4998 domain-containing protein [Puteibacter caeruleilacunae]